MVLQFETHTRLEELLRVTHRPSRLSSLILAPLPPPQSAAAIREASRADAETSRGGGCHLPWEPLLVKRVMERALDEVLREAQVMHAVDDLLTAPLPHFQQLFPEENLKDYSWIAQPTSDSGSCTGEEGSGRADARPSSTSESLKAEAPAAQLRPNNGEAAALVGTLEKSPPALRSPLLGHFVFHDAPLDPLPPVRPACRTAQLLLCQRERERRPSFGLYVSCPCQPRRPGGVCVSSGLRLRGAGLGSGGLRRGRRAKDIQTFVCGRDLAAALAGRLDSPRRKHRRGSRRRSATSRRKALRFFLAQRRPALSGGAPRLRRRSAASFSI